MKKILLLMVLVASCDKKETPTQPQASASASASVAPIVDAAPAKNEWSGNYTSAPGTLFVPDAEAWKGVKFRGEDAGDGLGDGTIKILITPDNLVTGEGSGSLGAFTIAGTHSDNVVTFTVSRKDPSDMGFSGTGRASITGDKLEGSMRVSKATGNVIREATFSLHR